MLPFKVSLSFDLLLTLQRHIQQLIVTYYIFQVTNSKNSKGEKEIETSNGIVVVETYDIEHLESLGIIKTNLKCRFTAF